MYKMMLYRGRPESCEGRLAREIRVYDFLDSLDIEYYRVDHDSAATMEECHTVEKVLDNVICKNLFLCNRQHTDFYLLVMPSDKPFKTKELSKQIGSSRLSFAGEEEMLKYIDVCPGSVSIMGLINDKEKKVKLLVDRDILDHEDFSCHPCMNTSSIKLKRADVLGKYLEAVDHSPTFVTLVGED